MNTSNFLLPHKYKRIGWVFLIPSFIVGLFWLITEFEPKFLTLNVPGLLMDSLGEGDKFFGMVKNNIFNEIIGIVFILSAICVAFSKEKHEDEYISQVRLESLVWATYINYGILILSFLLVYEFSFLWVMILNMFTILIFFILRFHWKLSTLKRHLEDEEYN